VVEDLAPIQDSLVVDVAQSQGDSYLALFVTLSPGQSLTDQLVGEVKSALRSQLSPRHVPDLVQQVGSIPRTLSGKKLELPIKKILEGVAAEKALDLASLSDPASLTPFRELALEFSRQAAARPSG
jgi:acetoacetyl-CoA synthetase